MAFADSSSADAPVLPAALKVLIAGGFGAGKTTMVGSISEITPLSTEEVMTEASLGVDDLSGVENKTTTAHMLITLVQHIMRRRESAQVRETATQSTATMG